jgi:hypothetical protein
MLPTTPIHYLETYQCPFNKIRLGNNGDGGYVIADIGDKYDCYISCGVSDEESFSKDFKSVVCRETFGCAV